MMTFDELNLSKPLLRALQDLGYTTPTPIQAKVFPVIMSGRDVVGIAQTGTGKTFAYLLPVLRQLSYSESKHPRVVIVVPTRELVLQVAEEVKKLSAYMSVRCVGIYGGTNIRTQKQAVYDGVDILVATPGRLVDLVACGILRLKSIQKLVIDEVDQLLALGFRPQMMNFMETLPVNRQTLMFSATLTEDVEVMISRFFRNPLWIEASIQNTPVESIKQLYYRAPNFYTKRNLLLHLLDTLPGMDKVLVFAPTKKIADKLAEELEEYLPGQTTVLHADKVQAQRIQALREFELGNARIMIANDIAARGLDVDDITHVVNFDTPAVPENYIHRIGRTGRAGKAGTTITFVSATEEEALQRIETLTGAKITRIPFPKQVEVTEDLIREEMPVERERSLLKTPKPDPTKGAAFHEKKAKNKKVNLGGARRQESLRRARLKYEKKKGK